jgi:hypothetical protein
LSATGHATGSSNPFVHLDYESENDEAQRHYAQTQGLRIRWFPNRPIFV